jgi:hypothetical protein
LEINELDVEGHVEEIFYRQCKTKDLLANQQNLNILAIKLYLQELRSSGEIRGCLSGLHPPKHPPSPNYVGSNLFRRLIRIEGGNP